jgi:branched-chain amino acid aminotransferase
MIVFFNGRFVAEAQAVVSVFDRSFLYGDGLFEVMRVCGGKPFRWAEHFDRFQRGAAFLKIQVPFAEGDLRKQALQLIERNGMPESLLRITLSRGVGLRGYSPKGADSPALVMTLHPAPDTDGQPPRWRVMTASFRLPANEPLAQFKTCNKLPQVLARAEAEAAGADEALLLNTNGEVVEGSTSNLFWIKDGVVCTPPLTSGILAGVTRLVVMEICQKLGLPTKEAGITPAELRGVDGVFISLSSWGVVEVSSLDGQEVRGSALTGKISKAYQEMIKAGRV